MTDTQRTHCTDTLYCTALSDRIHEQEGRRVKGFLVGVSVLFATGELFDMPVFYQDTAGEPPMYLNFCPFCGKDFAPRLQQFEEAKRAAVEKHRAAGKPDFIQPKQKKTKASRVGQA